MFFLCSHGYSFIIRYGAGTVTALALDERGKENFMVALLVLVANATAASGTRTVLFVLLIIAILLILVGAIIAMVTIYFYWKARFNKAEAAARADPSPEEWLEKR